MTVTVHFRAITDIVVDDLMGIAQAVGSRPELLAKLERGANSGLYQAVQRAVGLAVEAVRRRDADAARGVETMSAQIRQVADELMSSMAEGWSAGDSGSLEVLRLQTAFVDAVRQIFTLTKRIARTVTTTVH